MPTFISLSYAGPQARWNSALTLAASGVQFTNIVYGCLFMPACLSCRAAAVIATDKEDLVERVKEITGALTCRMLACLCVFAVQSAAS